MRIVLVDTSRTVLKIVGRMLEPRGHDVVPFTDGRAALQFIATHPDVAAVITSAELISMTGIEMCWETRLLANSQRSIYIVLMSSNYDRRHLAEALDMGADDSSASRRPPKSFTRGCDRRNALHSCRAN